MLSNRREIRIEWGDCDPAGIVFFPRYFAWFDACTLALLAAAGFEKRRIMEYYQLGGIPIVDTRARFLLPSSYGDCVEVETVVSEVRRSGFSLHHLLRKQGELAVEGFESRVWAKPHPSDSARLKAAPLPPELVSRLKGG